MNPEMAREQSEDLKRQSGDPPDATAASQLGRLAAVHGDWSRAQALLELAARLEPNSCQHPHNLGVVLLGQGKWKDAVARFRSALGINPCFSDALELLAFALEQDGDYSEAVDCYTRALPNSKRPARLLRRMAGMCGNLGQVSKAAELLERALVLEPGSSEIQTELASCLCSLGDLPAAIAGFGRAADLDPQNLVAWGQLFMALMYSDGSTPEEIFSEHVRMAASLQVSQHRPNAPAVLSERQDRLRVGYLSPDFRAHSVTTIVEPILRHHDRSRFDITCFCDSRRADGVTKRLHALNPDWNDTADLSDEALTEMIYQERIDILIDLVGHAGGGRMRVLAAHPARVQLTAFGYPNTTGLDSVEYRLSDSYCDPPGRTERLHTEQLVRLDPCFLCFELPQSVAIPEELSGRPFTFCSFNARPKISEPVIDLWSRVLNAVPHANLMLKSLEFADPVVRARLLARFERNGIAVARIRLIPPVPDRAAHLALYHQADLALDTFPYSGTITTLEALSMGVPVVTWPGWTHVERVSASILNSIGANEWIASCPEEYVQIAIDAAREGQRCPTERTRLRARIEASPIFQHRDYVRSFEKLLVAL